MRFGGARARLRPGAGGACMRWFVKAAAFNVLSAAPAGERLYHLLQDRVTRSTRVTEEGLRERIDLADWYLDVLEAERPRGLDGLRHVDIGAGWMPTIPLVFYAAGVDRQVLCDISRHLRIERVAEVVRAVRDLAGHEPRLAARASRLPPDVEPEQTLEDYLGALGIEYVAPYRLEDLARPGPTIYTCTGVLLHLRDDEIAGLLRAVAAELDGDGLLCGEVPLWDVYAYVDPSISPYNKWRSSDFVGGRLLTPRLSPFNRLTLGDYRRLFEASGLEIVRLEPSRPTPADMAAARRAPLAPPFRSVPPAELAVSRFVFAA